MSWLGLELELESVLLLIVYKRAMWLFKEMQFSLTAPRYSCFFDSMIEYC